MKREPRRPLAADDSDLGRRAVLHGRHDGDHARLGEVDGGDVGSGFPDLIPAFQADALEPAREPAVLGLGQRSQEKVLRGAVMVMFSPILRGSANSPKLFDSVQPAGACHGQNSPGINLDETTS